MVKISIPFLRDAFLSGDQEKLLYIPCVVPDKSRSDYLATVDVDPKSPTYSKVKEYSALSLVDHDLRWSALTVISRCLTSEMEFLNGIFGRGFWV
jgi:hypothetical protein